MREIDGLISDGNKHLRVFYAQAAESCGRGGVVDRVRTGAKKKNIESVPHTCCVKWFAHKKLNLRLKKIHSI